VPAVLKSIGTRVAVLNVVLAVALSSVVAVIAVVAGQLRTPAVIVGHGAHAALPIAGPVEPVAPVANQVPAKVPSSGGTVVTASTSTARRNPSANIAENPSYPSICQTQPTGLTCENDAITALNNGRAAMGLGPYNLPPGFTSLAPTAQLVVLSNLDRLAYGLTPITGQTAPLNQQAMTGVTNDTDPAGLLGTIGNLFYQQWTANWAVGWSSSIYTYYEWMYDDGPGSGNIDCTALDTSGCWGHRADTLTNFPGQVAMGVATGTSPNYHSTAFTEVYEGVTSGTPTYLPIVTGVLQEAATTTVQVTGLGLQTASAVTMGGQNTSFSVNSSTSLNAVAPTSSASTLTVTTNGGTSAPISTDGLVSASPTAPGSYVAVPPARLLDTRLSGGPVAAGASVLLPVAGHGGVPASGASAVVLNVTVTAPTRPGYVTVWPAGIAQPRTSNLNFTAGLTVSNLVMVPLGSGGAVQLVNASTGTAQLVADVSGYYLAGTPSTAGAFSSLSPARVLDTRYGTGAPAAAVPGGGTLVLDVDGAGGVPATGVAAVVLNVTVTNVAAPGYITAWADGDARPNASNLNFVAGQSIPNLVVAPVGADGSVDLYNGSGGPLSLVGDVSGYFLAGSSPAGGGFTPLTPSRLLDTRNATGAPAAAVPAGGSVRLQITGRGGVPTANVCAAVLNVTAVGPTSGGYVTVWADGAARPSTSNVNYTAGVSALPDLVVAPVGALGMVDLYASSPVQLVADIVGYLSCSSG
jgi:hypothetical protein